LFLSVPAGPGHDRRYAMDGSKLAALGWRNRVTFADGLAATVDWYGANEPWGRGGEAGDWDAYHTRTYGGPLGARRSPGTGTLTTSVSTGPGSRRRRRPERRARRGHGRGRAAGAGARRGARERAVHRPRGA